MPDHAPRRPGRAVVLAATSLTLVAGLLLKSPCLGPWDDGRQYNRLCYSDVAALYASEDRDRGLDEGRFPYVDGENEYPVLTGVAMWLTALPADSYPSYFLVTAALLSLAALITAGVLRDAAGRKALLFALAPTLLIYAFVNWDLIAVALATAGTVAYLRRRDVAAGALLGLGAAAKLYPGLLVIPFALGRLGDERPEAARHVVVSAAAAWIAVNLPFAVGSFERWSEFYRFNAARPADWDSLWYLASRHLGFRWDPQLLNVLAAATLALAAGGLWLAASRRRGFRAWTFGFPLLVAFLLTSKVYSPQYGLWLLPWFVLALPDLRLFALFEMTDAAVFVTRFQFFARYEGLGPGLPFWSFEIALLLRAAVLVACVAAWLGRQSRRAEPTLRPSLEAA